MEAFLQRPDGCKLFYIIDDFTDAWRPAPTVLFVHGLAESTEAWRAWVPHFARRYRVVRLDLGVSAARHRCPKRSSGILMS